MQVKTVNKILFYFETVGFLRDRYRLVHLWVAPLGSLMYSRNPPLPLIQEAQGFSA